MDDVFTSKILEELKKLEEIFNQNFDCKFRILKACLAVKAQMLIEGITLPFFLILVGKASGSKTTILGMVEVLPDCIKTYNFTSKSFVSHMANATKEEISKIDFLPKIKHKTLITPELGTMFSEREDKLASNLGILASILDGKGYISESGARGSRGYEGDYYFTWIGAIPSVSDHLLRTIGNLGPKIYFLDIDGDELTDEQEEEKIEGSITGKIHLQRLAEAQQQMKVYWEVLDQFPEKVNGKIPWNSEKDDPLTRKRIIASAILLSKLRVSITYKKTFEGIQMEVANREFPSRAATSLLNLAKGNAVLEGRNFVTESDLRVVLDVALSSAFKLRTKALKALLENNGELNTQQVMDNLKVSRQTALNIMKELVVVEIAEYTVKAGTTKPSIGIQIRGYFKWMLLEQYKKYWKRS